MKQLDVAIAFATGFAFGTILWLAGSLLTGCAGTKLFCPTEQAIYDTESQIRRLEAYKKSLQKKLAEERAEKRALELSK